MAAVVEARNTHFICGMVCSRFNNFVNASRLVRARRWWWWMGGSDGRRADLSSNGKCVYNLYLLQSWRSDRTDAAEISHSTLNAEMEKRWVYMSRILSLIKRIFRRFTSRQTSSRQLQAQVRIVKNTNSQNRETFFISFRNKEGDMVFNHSVGRFFFYLVHTDTNTQTGYAIHSTLYDVNDLYVVPDNTHYYLHVTSARLHLTTTSRVLEKCWSFSRCKCIKHKCTHNIWTNKNNNKKTSELPYTHVWHLLFECSVYDDDNKRHC